MSTLLLAVNRGASRAPVVARDRIVATLNHGHDVEVVETGSVAESTEVASEAAAAGVEIVAALGGDGTARSIAEGLAGTGAALACLPAGSRNVFARMLGTPRDPLAAAGRLAAGDTRARRVDLGLLAGRPFLFAASVGVGAHANEQLSRHPRFKARLGAAYGTATAIAAAASYLARPPRIRVTAGRSAVEAVSLVVQNATPLTYLGRRPLELCERVSLASGTTSIAVLRELVPTGLVSIPLRLLVPGAPRAIRHPHVSELEGVVEARIEIAGGRRVPVDLDGDPAGSFDATDLGVAPGALRVLA